MMGWWLRWWRKIEQGLKTICKCIIYILLSGSCLCEDFIHSEVLRLFVYVEFRAFRGWFWQEIHSDHNICECNWLTATVEDCLTHFCTAKLHSGQGKTISHWSHSSVLAHPLATMLTNHTLRKTMPLGYTPSFKQNTLDWVPIIS